MLVVGSVLRVNAPSGCIPVVTSRGSFTAAALDQSSGTVDGMGLCDIGDYISSSITVSGLTVKDAIQYGIFVDSGSILPVPSTGPITVPISATTVYNIGDHSGTMFTPSGAQHGIGIIYDSGTSGPVASGNITLSYVHDYQKGGIVINHNSNVATLNNTVKGLGPVPFIAQNGIQYSRDAVGTIRGNTVSDNFYTGGTGILANGDPCGGMNPRCPPGRQYVSCGILLFAVDPNMIQRGQNDVSNGNQRNFAIITDSALG